MIIHLTETGFNAGRRLCLTDRSDGSTNVHAAYASINKPEYRVNCCSACLKVWAAEAYDDHDDDMPTWVKQLRDELKTVGSLRLNDSGE